MVYTSRIIGNADRRPQAFWGALIGAGASLIGGLVSSSQQSRAQKRALEEQQRLAQQQLEVSNQNQLASTLNNYALAQQSYDDKDYNLKYRIGGVKRLGSRNIMITDGGNAKRIGNNTYLLRGGSHEDINETGQTGIGINVGGNEIEAEGGEVAQRKGNSLRIYSAQPILGGISPAQAIMRGYNKDKVFNAQQRFKKNNGIKDDGSQQRNGGLTSKDRGSSKHPYPSVSSKDFAGGGRSYPIPTKADAVDALRLAGLHGRSDVRSKVYSKYPSLRKKSLLGSCNRPVKGMRAKFAIGGKEDKGYDMTGELSPVITTARYRTPSFTTVDTAARAIPNFGTIKVPSYVPTSTVPYIPQRHNRSRTIFSGGDYLGLGIDTLAALSTGLVNYNTAGKYVLPDRAPIIQASKLPTTYNVNPEIEEIKRYRDRLTGQTFNNTSNSVAALNRSSAINLDALSNLSKLWATKENEENKMLTEDAKNQQTVAAQNVQNELARQSEIARIKNEANQAKGDALNVGLSGLSQAWTNFWTAGRTAYEDDQSRRAMIASSKDATPTRLMEMDFDLSPDVIAALYRGATEDRTKRFYLSRLSPKQRQNYGIN